MMTIPRTFRALAVSAAVLAVAACGGGNSQGGGSSQGDGSTTKPPASKTAPSTTTGSSATSSSTAPPRHTGSQSLVTAGTTALNKVGKGTVTSIDAERGGTVWEVQVVTSGGVEHEANVSRDGKKIISGPRIKHTDAEDKAENRQEVRGAKLDYKAAAKKILAARSGKITELNLDDSRGQIVWEADVHHFGTKYEVKINASSGKIIKNKPDHGDDDDD